MQRTIAIAVVALFAIAAMPTVQAENVNATYDIPSGALRLNASTGCGDLGGSGLGTCGPGLSWRIADPAWDDWNEGIFSDSGDETFFGPAGFTADDNPDDTLGSTVLTPGFTAAFSTARALVLGEDGFNIGVQIRPSDCGDCYTDFAVSITDTLPTQSYYSFCVITEYADGRSDSDNWCGEDPACRTDPAACDDINDPRVSGCGALSLSTAVPSGGELNAPVAFVYANHVDESTGGTCHATSGTMTIAMS